MNRRDLLASLSALGAVGAWRRAAQDDPGGADESTGGPTVRDLAAAEKVLGISFTDVEREQALGAVEEILGRTALRPGFVPGGDAWPATSFDPYAGADRPAGNEPVVPPQATAGARPGDDRLAYASLAQLRGLLDRRELSSVELTRLTLDRIGRLDEKLEAIVTTCTERALAEANRCDGELKAGDPRGFLHGIPYGAKDLFDSAGIRTTYGAKPFRDRVPTADAEVVERLGEAGAVLAAKTSLGALAYGDIWFGGRTNCPWNLELGSSGSSAGSASGVAAGLFPYALGTETYGSIVSPSVRNGTVGLRPTFDTVSRRGAMALCWSLDKVGPIARRVEDALAVLAATASRPLRSEPRDLGDLRVGYRAAWFEGERGGDPRTLELLREAGVELVEVELPEGPWESLLTILFVEAAAAFEALTREGLDDELAWQEDVAWPNSFRAAWFTPAIEFVQADRLRSRLVARYAELFAGVDALVGPPFAEDLVLTTNFTGHPCLVLRSSVDGGTPRSICLWGQLGGEATIAKIGARLEAGFDCWHVAPAGF